MAERRIDNFLEDDKGGVAMRLANEAMDNFGSR